MFKLFTKIFKTRSPEEEKLSAAAQNFDELMGKVEEDQKDVTKLKGHMRAEWDDIGKDVDEVRQGVDKVMKDAA